jgi:hypothetical protein
MNAEFAVTVHVWTNNGNALIITFIWRLSNSSCLADTSEWFIKMVPVKSHHCATGTQLHNKNLNISVTVQISPLEGTDIMVLVLCWTADSYAADRGNSAFLWKLKWTLFWAIISFLRFQPKIMYIFLVSPYICPNHIILVDLKTQNSSVKNTDCKAPDIVIFFIITLYHNQGKWLCCKKRNDSFIRKKKKKHVAIWPQHCVCQPNISVL